MRPRRMRKDEFSRRLMREHHLRTDDLIYPVFVMEGHQEEEAIPSMPGIKRQSIDFIIDTAKECFKLGIPAIALFPVIDAQLKTLFFSINNEINTLTFNTWHGRNRFFLLMSLHHKDWIN